MSTTRSPLDRILHVLVLAGLSVGAALWTTAPQTARADVPETLSHQGRLLDTDGEPVTGQKTLRVTLYDAPQEGAILWEAEKSVEFDEHGYYSVVLGGPDNPVDATKLSGGSVWLGVAVEGGEELKPRLELNAAPFAVLAGEAESVSEGAVTGDSLADDFKVGWDAVDSPPQGLDDGDDDTLGNLQCTDRQIPRFNGQNWQCSPDGPQTMAWSDINNVPQDLQDGDQDTLGGMNCQQGQRAQFDGTDWSCVDSADNEDFATTGQSCTAGEVVRGIDDQGGLVCATDKDTDTTRSDAEIVKAVENADNYVTKSGDSTIQGNLTTTGTVEANSIKTGRIRGTHLKFRKCNGNGYDCSPKACQKLCEKNNERMAFFDEVFAWASAGNNHCAHMWMLDGDVPDKVVSAYPMYYNRTSSGCGPTNTGDIPRMVRRRVRDWDTSLTVDCACATIR